ncbi:MND1-interacting protein 1 [Senna tora]|uniref:MND1-interacting protein 1 n=1 Tax=Senna tora TaxID=362788 RepID=A0A834T5D8_9FABA|nr:MND1-interacting protein 1 [Senna tora]
MRPETEKIFITKDDDGSLRSPFHINSPSSSFNGNVMGFTRREKHIRATRSHRSPKAGTDSGEKTPVSKSILESSLKEFKNQMFLNDSSPNPNSRSAFNPSREGTGLRNCTEEQLEAILLEALESQYNEALSKLVQMGYDKDVALRAILRNGHCFGDKDVLKNILHNTLAYLNSNDSSASNDENPDDSEPIFSDLRQLVEQSLAAMLGLLKQIKPNLSRGDVLWSLVMNDLHVLRASSVESPVLPVQGVACPDPSTAEAVSRFHGGGSDLPVSGFSSHGSNLTLQRPIEFPKRLDLSPSTKLLLKRNVATFAAGFRANSEQLHTRAMSCSSLDSPPVSGNDVPTEQSGDSQNLNNQDSVNSMKKDEVNQAIVNILNQIKELENEVKKQKEWAHEKAVQSARSLSNGMIELKLLKMEKEETQRLMKGKHAIEDTTMKRLSEMENSLRRTIGQVNRANAAVRRLEVENAEIRADLEASKLSASESDAACSNIVKREKKYMKKILAWEKVKAQLQQEISDEKEKILQIEEELVRIKKCQKDAEVKWREELKAKEEAFSLVGEERRSKEAVEADNKRKLEVLRLKIEIDFQRHKDDLSRLEQELSRLRASSESNTSPSEGAKTERETIAKLLQELEKLEDSSNKEVSSDRECVICMKDEVSVVFLPCAHQVMCASCSDAYGGKAKAACPCCHVPIEQRIRVFGASST